MSLCQQVQSKTLMVHVWRLFYLKCYSRRAAVKTVVLDFLSVTEMHMLGLSEFILLKVWIYKTKYERFGSKFYFISTFKWFMRGFFPFQTSLTSLSCNDFFQILFEHKFSKNISNCYSVYLLHFFPSSESHSVSSYFSPFHMWCAIIGFLHDNWLSELFQCTLTWLISS